MTKVKALQLPKIYPSAKAMTSFRDNLNVYDPEFWEMFYDSRRYLKQAPDGYVCDRYSGICKNFECLTAWCRHDVPRQLPKSSWYWFVKEHQTRYELFLRGLDLPRNFPEMSSPKVCSIPARLNISDASSVLFRYGKRKYLRQLVEKGSLRVNAASEFLKMEGDIAREDDELNECTMVAGDLVKITNMRGVQMPVVGELRHSISTVNYYTYCVSRGYSRLLENEFGGSCVVIKDVDEFSRRLDLAVNSVLDGWYFYHNPIFYYDPYDRSEESIDPATHKDFRFAYQREYRFLWMHLDGVEALGHFDVELGDLSDIAELL